VHNFESEQVVGSSIPLTQSDSIHLSSEKEENEQILKFYISFYKNNNKNQLFQYLKTLKEQIKEGNCKLSDLNPLFLSFNYGRAALNCEDHTKIGIDKCDLLYREGIYINNSYLLCSIYKYSDYISKEIMVKILAFDNQKGAEYILDLEYCDLLELTEGNVGIFYNSHDLSTFLVNNLAFFKNLKEEEILVCENRLYFEEYVSNSGGLDQKASYDNVNKQLLSKYKKRDNFLHQD